MAVEGKKINQLDSMSTVTNETVFPAVYVNNGAANATANKVTLEQVKNYIEQDVYTQTQTNTLLSGKQDVLPAGTTGYFLRKTASGVEWAQAASGTQDVESISATSGTIALETNKVYKVTLDGNTTFTLPTTVDDTKFNQIYLQINVTDTITVNFGTTNYFTVEPVLNEGSNWLNYEYNTNENAWYVGQIGAVASSGANTDLSNLTDTGKIQIAHLAMPSSTYDELSTSSLQEQVVNQFVAPADGYFALYFDRSSSLYLSFSNTSKQGIGIYYQEEYGVSVGSIPIWVPAEKGDTVAIWFSSSYSFSAQSLRFYYANGSISEHQGA